MKLFQICFLAAISIQSAVAEVSDEKAARFHALVAGEYHYRFLEAIDAGKLDFPETIIPADIVNDARAKAYFRAGFFRGVGQYQVESGLKNTNSQRGCVPLHGVFKWELEGFIKGCAAAIEVGNTIQTDLHEIASRELQRNDNTPDSAIEAAIREIEKQMSDREAQQRGADNPASGAEPAVRGKPETGSETRPE